MFRRVWNSPICGSIMCSGRYRPRNGPSGGASIRSRASWPLSFVLGLVHDRPGSMNEPSAILRRKSAAGIGFMPSIRPTCGGNRSNDQAVRRRPSLAVRPSARRLQSRHFHVGMPRSGSTLLDASWRAFADRGGGELPIIPRLPNRSRSLGRAANLSAESCKLNDDHFVGSAIITSNARSIIGTRQPRFSRQCI